jgi:hypothetical protein
VISVLRRHPALSTLGAGLLLIAIFYAFPAASTEQNAVYAANGFASAIVIVVALLRGRSRGPVLHWWLLAGTLALWATGDLVSMTYPFVFGGETPFPGLPDWIYLLAYATLLWALVLLIRRDATGLRDALDALIIGCGGGLLVWQTVIGPTAHDSGTWLPTLVASAYPGMDLLLLVALAQLIVSSSGTRTFAFRALLLGGVVLFASDIVYGIQSIAGTYRSGSWLDAGWLINYTLWAAAAVSARAATAQRADSRNLRRG